MIVQEPSGIPWPINRAFRPVCSKASAMVFTGEEPRTLTTWLLKSTSTFLTPEGEKKERNNKENDYSMINEPFRNIWYLDNHSLELSPTTDGLQLILYSINTAFTLHIHHKLCLLSYQYQKFRISSSSEVPNLHH